MFSRAKIITYTGSYSDNIKRLKRELDSADAVLIGAGAGLSTSAGLTYSGERFEKYFADFHRKYGITDMYSGGFYPYKSLEEYWAWWSRHIYYNRYGAKVGKAYLDLLQIIKYKNYFVLSTNVDHQFQRAGFDKSRLFYTQGDYGLWQCSVPCRKVTYDNEDKVKKMVKEQRNMKIPSKLIPYCPKCGAPMTMNLRCDNTFVEDVGWHIAETRYEKFVFTNKNSKILLLELGVGSNTPTIIKYPFLYLTAHNKNAVYACVNLDKAFSIDTIEKQSICINGDISKVLCELK